MVLAEKGNENARNGRRSRGPSPNGHVAAESTSEDESKGKQEYLFFSFLGCDCFSNIKNEISFFFNYS